MPTISKEERDWRRSQHARNPRCAVCGEVIVGKYFRDGDAYVCNRCNNERIGV